MGSRGQLAETFAELQKVRAPRDSYTFRRKGRENKTQWSCIVIYLTKDFLIPLVGERASKPGESEYSRADCGVQHSMPRKLGHSPPIATLPGFVAE